MKRRESEFNYSFQILLNTKMVNFPTRMNLFLSSVLFARQEPESRSSLPALIKKCFLFMPFNTLGKTTYLESL